MRPELKVLYVGTDHCVAVCANLLVFVAHNDPQPSVVRLLPGFVRSLKANGPGPYGFIVVLPPDNPPPKEEARKTIKEVFHIFSDTMSFGTMAVEMTGFTAAGQRSVINLIIFAVRPAIPVKVFGTVEEASRWTIAQQQKDARYTLAELVDAIEALKREYRAGTLRVTI